MPTKVFLLASCEHKQRLTEYDVNRARSVARVLCRREKFDGVRAGDQLHVVQCLVEIMLAGSIDLPVRTSEGLNDGYRGRRVILQALSETSQDGCVLVVVNPEVAGEICRSLQPDWTQTFEPFGLAVMTFHRPSSQEPEIVYDGVPA